MVRTEADISETAKIAGAGVLGALGGLVATAVALGSLEFGIFGAIGGAVATTIAAAIRVERASM
jgi:hypothetical protein